MFAPLMFAFEEQTAVVERCAEATNFVLSVFHCEKVRAAAREDRQIWLRSMCKPARQVWSDLDT